MEFTMPMAVALVGSVASVCLTLWKVLSSNNEESSDASLKDQIAEVKQHLAVQQQQISDLKQTVERLQTNFEKLTDVLIKFLSNK